MPESFGLSLAVGLGVVLVAWYWAGNELMRRRAHRLAVWTKRAIDPLGGTQTIHWLGGQAFRIGADGVGVKPPFRSLTVTGLVESWDVPIVWAWNRLHGRRDMIVLQATLRVQPLWGLEVYRPGSVLAGDARALARQEGWPESPLDNLCAAAPGGLATTLVSDLLAIVGPERARLLRLAVRRQGQHLTLALNVDDPVRQDPAALADLTGRLAARLEPR